MNVAWALFWGGSRSTKPCVFPCKVAAAGDERYLVCAAVAAGGRFCRELFVANCSSYVFCNEWFSCVRSSIVFRNSVSADRIVVAVLSFAAGSCEKHWLHQGCDSDLSADF